MSTDQQHTPEPWVIQKPRGPQHAIDRLWEIVKPLPSGELIVIGEHTGIDCLTEANARRIVACVNACAGIHTDALERIEDGELHSALIRLRTYKAQRDELQDALRQILAVQHLPNQHPDKIAASSGARQLLAKVAK